MFLKKEYANILKLNYLNKQKNRINTLKSSELKSSELKSSELTLTDLSTSKICLIYAYYERKNEQKNQKNLSFFIKYGLDKTKWKHLDITYIFVINGFQCEVVIPKQDNIHIIKQKNWLLLRYF